MRELSFDAYIWIQSEVQDLWTYSMMFFKILISFQFSFKKVFVLIFEKAYLSLPLTICNL